MTSRRDASKALESIRQEYGDEQAFQLLIDAMLMLEAEIEDLDDELGQLQEFLESEGYEFMESDEVEVEDEEFQNIPLNPFKVNKVKVTDCYKCVCEICGNDCSTCRFREERCKNCRK